MFKHPLGLEWGTVGGEEGWLDPRVKGIKKLLPRNMGAKEERKIFKEISQKQAKERHSKRWFVGDNTVKGTKPDLTPVKNVGGKKGMRSLLQKRTKDLAWEKGWSQLNPDQIANLGGKGDRVTNKVAQQLMKSDELEVQKALSQHKKFNLKSANKDKYLERLQNKETNITESKNIPGEANNFSLENMERVWGGRFPDMVGSAKKYSNLSNNLSNNLSKPKVVTNKLTDTQLMNKWWDQGSKGNNVAIQSGAWDDDKEALWNVAKKHNPNLTTKLQKPIKPPAIKAEAAKLDKAAAGAEALQQQDTAAAASGGASAANIALMAAKVATALFTDTSKREHVNNKIKSLQGSAGLFDEVDKYSWA